MLDKRTIWEAIWLNSNNYGDLLMTSSRLADSEEFYAAMLILFNAEELIIKSALEDYSHNLIQDLNKLLEIGAIGQIEHFFLNDQNYGMRNIRNIITHRELYSYALAVVTNGRNIFHPFSEMDTWKEIYNMYSDIIYNILLRITSSNGEVNQADIEKEIIHVMPEAKTVT